MSDPSALPTFAQVATEVAKPPADSPASFLGWALAIALLVIVVVVKVREKERKDELTRALAEVEDLKTKNRDTESKHETKVATLEARKDREIELLRERLDETEQELREQIGKAARSLTLARYALDEKGPNSRDLDFEESTLVRAAMNEERRADVERRAAESTPPRQFRPRLPSKPR